MLFIFASISVLIVEFGVIFERIAAVSLEACETDIESMLVFGREEAL